MKHSLVQLRQVPLFRAAMLVPAAIALVFSLFSLTAAPDAARLAGAINIGLVKLDTGMVFPPIKVSDRLQQGLAQQVPFGLTEFTDENSARAALEAGNIAAFVVFPEEFSQQAFSDEPVKFSVVTAGNLTLAEAKIAEQMPSMLQSGIAAAVNGLRLAIAKGQIPTGALPVELSVERLYVPKNPSASVAPFASAYTIWLGAMVGGLLLFLSTRTVGSPRDRAVLRTLLPIGVSGLSSLVLTTIVASTAGLQVGFLGFWITAWTISLVLAWFFGGFLAVLRLPGLIILIPLVFYQAALGGTQMPAAAAPEWLVAMVGSLPFEHVGAVLRAQIIGGAAGLDLVLAGATALLGLVLIALGSLFLEGNVQRDG